MGQYLCPHNLNFWIHHWLIWPHSINTWLHKQKRKKCDNNNNSLFTGNYTKYQEYHYSITQFTQHRQENELKEITASRTEHDDADSHVNRSSSTTNVFALQLALVTFQLKPLEFSCGICFSINASLYGAKSIIMPQWIIWSWYTGRWWVVQRGRGDWAGEQPAQAPPRCTKCNSPHINGQCTNHHIAV